MEIWRFAREIGRVKCEDQWRLHAMACTRLRSGFVVLTTIHGQMRLQLCTLVSTNVILGRMDSAHTEMTAMFQQVLTMLQQGPVRQRSRSLSMHSQVEPVGFNSQTTRVRHHPRV